jgi:AcrR family transcriptional regulator
MLVKLTDRFDGLFIEGYLERMALTSPSRVRRTQAERRTHTRTLLLEATLASLSELGYAGTTTLEVERRAGVSRGARLHHFPNKAALLSAAMEWLNEQLSEHYAAFAATPTRKQERQRVRAGLHELYAVFQHPYYVAVVELTVAARTDEELRAQLRLVSDRSRSLALDAAKKLFPVLRPSDAERLVEAIRVAFVGLRMQEGVIADKRHTELVLSVLEDAIVSRIKQID